MKKKSPPAPGRPTRTSVSVRHAGPALGWTFLTNHSHVLICLHRDPRVRTREVAERVGITERAVQRIIVELEAAGVITREKDGRRNVYHIDHARPLRHPVEQGRTVRDLLKLVDPASGARRRPNTRSPRKRSGAAA